MLKVCERFPQLGGIREFMELPRAEQALYEQYAIYAIEEESKMPTFKISAGGGKHR